MGLDLAILSCGPSLQGFLDAPTKHGAYMAVNRAARVWPCRWWVARDTRILETVVPMGSHEHGYKTLPQICTDNDTIVPDSCPCSSTVTIRDRHLMGLGDGSTRFVPPTRLWNKRSALYAIVVAVFMCEAAQITLYGYDLAGDRFWDGDLVYTPGVHSTLLREPLIEPERWKPERLKLQAVIAWAKNTGVSVCHGQPRQTASVDAS